MEAADLWNDTHSINLLIYSSLGFTLVGVDFSRLILYTVVLFAPDHQHSLLARAWDWHRYYFSRLLVGRLPSS